MARLRDCLPPREARCRPPCRKVESLPCGPSTWLAHSLRVSIPGLAAFWPQAEIAADIATSLEAFLAAQRQNVRQRRELTDAVDFNQSLGLWIVCLRESLDRAVVLLNRHCHCGDLLEHRAQRLNKTRRKHGKSMSLRNMESSDSPRARRSPNYFASHKVPLKPQELKDHACIGFRFSNGLYRREFEKGRRALTISPQGPVSFDDPDLVIQAVLNGVGIRNSDGGDTEGPDHRGTSRSNTKRVVPDFPRLLSLLSKPPQSACCSRSPHRNTTNLRLNASFELPAFAYYRETPFRLPIQPHVSALNRQLLKSLVFGMYGPPCCKQKSEDGQLGSARMYTALLEYVTTPGQDGMRFALFLFNFAVLKDPFRNQVCSYGSLQRGRQRPICNHQGRPAVPGPRRD